MEDVNQKQTNLEDEPNQELKPNLYEKVIIATKLARKINDLRTIAHEQLAEEELENVDPRKVTTIALNEIDSGKVQFTRTKKEPDEETFDLT